MNNINMKTVTTDLPYTKSSNIRLFDFGLCSIVMGNPAFPMATAVSTIKIDSNRSFYYEFTHIVPGLSQIGFGRADTVFNSPTSGAGDISGTYAIDGLRKLVWNRECFQYASGRIEVFPGDVYGCLYLCPSDAPSGTPSIAFYRNGKSLGGCSFTDIRATDLAPMFSLGPLAAGVVNYGGLPFRYPPEVAFQTFKREERLKDCISEVSLLGNEPGDNFNWILGAVECFSTFAGLWPDSEGPNLLNRNATPMDSWSLGNQNSEEIFDRGLLFLIQHYLRENSNTFYTTNTRSMTLIECISILAIGAAAIAHVPSAADLPPACCDVDISSLAASLVRHTSAAAVVGAIGAAPAAVPLQPMMDEMRERVQKAGVRVAKTLYILANYGFDDSSNAIQYYNGVMSTSIEGGTVRLPIRFVRPITLGTALFLATTGTCRKLSSIEFAENLIHNGVDPAKASFMQPSTVLPSLATLVEPCTLAGNAAAGERASGRLDWHTRLSVPRRRLADAVQLLRKELDIEHVRDMITQFAQSLLDLPILTQQTAGNWCMLQNRILSLFLNTVSTCERWTVRLGAEIRSVRASVAAVAEAGVNQHGIPRAQVSDIQHVLQLAVDVYAFGSADHDTLVRSVAGYFGSYQQLPLGPEGRPLLDDGTELPFGGKISATTNASGDWQYFVGTTFPQLGGVIASQASRNGAKVEAMSPPSYLAETTAVPLLASALLTGVVPSFMGADITRALHCAGASPWYHQHHLTPGARTMFSAVSAVLAVPASSNPGMINFLLEQSFGASITLVSATGLPAATTIALDVNDSNESVHARRHGVAAAADPAWAPEDGPVINLASEAFGYSVQGAKELLQIVKESWGKHTYFGRMTSGICANINTVITILASQPNEALLFMLKAFSDVLLVVQELSVAAKGAHHPEDTAPRITARAIADALSGVVAGLNNRHRMQRKANSYCLRTMIVANIMAALLMRSSPSEARDLLASSNTTSEMFTDAAESHCHYPLIEADVPSFSLPPDEFNEAVLNAPYHVAVAAILKAASYDAANRANCVNTNDEEEAEDENICPICYTETAVARVVPCGHKCCVSCAERWAAGGHTTCFACHQEYEKIHFPEEEQEAEEDE